MKLQLDTTTKTVTIEDDSIKMRELVDTLKKLLPDDEWQEYNIICKKITNWTNPIVIKEKEYVPYQQWPWHQPYNPIIGPGTPIYKAGGSDDLTVLCSTNSVSAAGNSRNASTIFNIEA